MILWFVGLIFTTERPSKFPSSFPSPPPFSFLLLWQCLQATTSSPYSCGYTGIQLENGQFN